MSKKLLLSLVLLLMLSGCAWEADGVGIGGTYLRTSIRGQDINEVMPLFIINFKPKEKYNNENRQIH